MQQSRIFDWIKPHMDYEMIVTVPAWVSELQHPGRH